MLVRETLSRSAMEANAAASLMVRQSQLDTTIVFKNKRWRTRELAPLFLRVRNQINSVIFGLLSLIETAPDRLYTEQSLMLSVFEQNNFVGFQSGEVLFTLQFMQFICEGLVPARGQSIAFLQHIQRFLELVFQLKLAVSIYFHRSTPQ